MKRNQKTAIILATITCLLVISIFLSLGYGKGLGTLFRSFFTNEGFGLILRKIRIPRTIIAFLVGGSLGVCGVTLQSILRNPLAEPYTLGIAGGASFGIALSTIIGLQQVLGAFANPLFGFGGAMLSVAVVFALSRKRFFDPNSMVPSVLL